MGVHVVFPSSGFQAGVHQVKSWERIIVNAVSYYRYAGGISCTMEVLRSKIANMSQVANDAPVGRAGVRKTRKALWGKPVDGRPRCDSWPDLINS